MDENKTDLDNSSPQDAHHIPNAVETRGRFKLSELPFSRKTTTVSKRPAAPPQRHVEDDEDDFEKAIDASVVRTFRWLDREGNKAPLKDRDNDPWHIMSNLVRELGSLRNGDISKLIAAAKDEPIVDPTVDDMSKLAELARRFKYDVSIQDKNELAEDNGGSFFNNDYADEVLLFTEEYKRELREDALAKRQKQNV